MQVKFKLRVFSVVPTQELQVLFRCIGPTDNAAAYIVFRVPLSIQPIVYRREWDRTEFFGGVFAPPFAIDGDMLGV